MSPIPRLVIATHNRKKAGEMVHILSARFPGLEILTLADYPGAPEPDEMGDTYAENAAIKAESGAKFTGEWCLADDAGLEIDALGGAPGVHSKRFEGADTPFPVKIQKILDAMAETQEADRGARFQCWIAFAAPPADATETKLIHAICEGRIATEPSGNGGFGYDPIFWLTELNCTMADLTPEQKHAVSHRGKVLHAFGNYLETAAP